MDLTIFETIATLGIGGLIAIVTLMWKRADDASHREEMKRLHGEHEEELKRVIESAARREDRIIELVKANTDALKGLQIAIETMTRLTELEQKIEEVSRATPRRR
jgi:transposase